MGIIKYKTDALLLSHGPSCAKRRSIKRKVQDYVNPLDLREQEGRSNV